MELNMEQYQMETKEVNVKKGQFINRELSWINFNYRVLECSRSKTLLNERLNFLGITTSNLDEFISVRVGNLLHEEDKKTYKRVINKIHIFIQDQVSVYHSICDLLKKENIEITKMSKLDKKEILKAKKIFTSNIFPLLTPILIENVNGFYGIASGDPCIAVIIKTSDEKKLAVVSIPKEIDGVFKIGNKVVMVEDLVSYFLDELFINKNIKHYGIFRIIKDMSFCLNHDESRFIIDRMNDILIQRKRSNALFLEVESKMDKDLLDTLMNQLNLQKSLVHMENEIVDYRRFKSVKLLGPKHSFKPFKGKSYDGKGGWSIFSIIDEHDILLHHPYDSYDTVVRFINHAAIDPDVIAIKQTLYRVSSIDSPVVKGLCTAAENGKAVFVLVEIKARFDEENNIHIINKLEASGCHVIFGSEMLKTHCKMCTVIKKDGRDHKIYSHIATGNYNEKTSKIYTDLSYFTSNQEIGLDLLYIFNILSGISTPDTKLKRIAYSPVNLRKTLINKIDKEIGYAKKGKKASIFIKVNSISDSIMVKKLYEAADKGVKVYIICRGVCSIVPKKNIYIKSIVGRFLEHSRIYQFNNNGDEEYYISSADLLTRNLDRRVEILLSLTNSDVVDKIKRIIHILKKDEANSFVMDEKGKFSKPRGGYDCHQKFVEDIDE